ncbi:MAG: hypothetical protein ACREWE_16140 [Gammaproteobacteria bacterium]
MEWVIVKYPRMRDVFIDGRRSGPANLMLIVREGTQTFDLGTPIDYRPSRRTVAVTGTSAADPAMIEFEPV